MFVKPTARNEIREIREIRVLLKPTEQKVMQLRADFFRRRRCFCSGGYGGQLAAPGVKLEATAGARSLAGATGFAPWAFAGSLHTARVFLMFFSLNNHASRLSDHAASEVVIRA